MTIKKQNPNNKKKLKYIYSFDKKEKKILIRAKVFCIVCFPPKQKVNPPCIGLLPRTEEIAQYNFSAKDTLRTLNPM